MIGTDANSNTPPGLKLERFIHASSPSMNWMIADHMGGGASGLLEDEDGTDLEKKKKKNVPNEGAPPDASPTKPLFHFRTCPRLGIIPLTHIFFSTMHFFSLIF